MALIKFLKGENSNLPSLLTEGQIYATKEGKLYMDLNFNNVLQRIDFSNIYDDTSLTNRITALENALSNLINGDNLSYGGEGSEES